MYGIGLQLTSTTIIGGSYSPTSLFAANEPGVWFDNNDSYTLFKDTAGTQPVTTPGDAVALALDKSRSLALGAELVVNGDFSNGSTGWTSQLGAALTAVSGGLQVAGQAATAFSLAYQSVTADLSKALRITWTATIVTAGSTLPGVGIGANVRQFSTSGQYSMIVLGGRANNKIDLSPGTDGVVVFDNVSVRELAGNHATQATTASRPLYALLPANGVRNLANGSASVGDVAIWPASTVRNGVTATKVGSGFDTDGLPYVDLRFQGTASGTFHEIAFNYLPSPASSGQSYTCSAIMRVIGGSTANTSGLTVRVQELDIADGFIDNSVSDRVTASVDTISTSTNAIATGVKVRALVELAFTTATAIDVTYRIKALQFELGSTRTAYQFNYSNVNIAQPPFTQVGALLYDGVDDFMATPAIDFQSYTWDGQARRNFALGSAQPANDAFWPSIRTFNGITSTKIGSGFDIDGLPYVDVRFQGTATLTYHDGPYADNNSRTAATVGQSWTASCTFQRIGGSTTGVIGMQVLAAEEAAPFIFVGSASSTPITSTTEVRVSATRVIASGNQSRTAALLAVTNGATVDVTYRVKGLQLEQNATATTWQGTGTDKVSVFAGVRKTSDADSTIAELTASADATNGAFGVYANAPGGPGIYQVRSRGTTLVSRNFTKAAPDSAVFTLIGDISAPNIVMRYNGTQVSQSNATQGTGNYSNSILYIGSRGSTSMFFRGYMYEIIARGALTEANLLARTETSINQQTGAY